jgi:hypothetical protein
MVLVFGVAVGTTVAAAPVLAPSVITFAQASGAAAVTDTLTSGAALITPGVPAAAALGEGALFAVGLTAGPISCLVVGCNKNDDRDSDRTYTWDCWKPVVWDTSARPSYGMPLRCLAAHPNVRFMSVDQGELLVANIFGECFRLTPVSVEGALALHASILSS